MIAPTSATELLTQQFYDWERRGRGWKVWPEPVDIEPPYRPFFGHFLPQRAVVDDGQSDTVLSWLAGKFLGRSSAPPPPQLPEETEPEPEPTGERVNLATFEILVPPDLDPDPARFEQFLQSLSLLREPIAFELVGHAGRITTQLAVHPADAALVQRQFQAFFPEAALIPEADAMEEAWQYAGVGAFVDFGLEQEFMRPLAPVPLDPYMGLLGAMSELRPDETAVFQVLFAPVRNPWAESVMRAVTDNQGEPFFLNAPGMVKEAERKVSRPLYATVVRMSTQSTGFDRAWEVARNVAGALWVFCDPARNELIPLTNDDYPLPDHQEDFQRRQSRRSGMLLNVEELVGFVHLPSAAVTVPTLRRLAARTKAAPLTVRRSDGLLLGNNVNASEIVLVRLSAEQRVRHTHLIGSSGTGKTTLLFNLIRQDIENGEGMAVLDPHGDLIDRLLGVIPERRIEDVILFDPADEEYSIAFNILTAHTDLEKNLIASDLVSVFERLSATWGDQMASVLQNAILAFLESSRSGTLADLRRFLLDAAYRNEFLASVRDPDVVYYWRKGFPQLGGNKSIGPVLTRLETFLARKAIRYIVSQPANRLDFGMIMDTGKILLAKLPQGQIGKENAFLLGSLLIGKLQQTAMSRQAQAQAQRRNYWCYLDEFQDFITPSMAEILTGARKYRVGLILAHQELRHLERNREVAGAVLSNCATRVVFRVGDDDARKLAAGFASFEATDLLNLDTGQAICRVERSDHEFNLSVPFPKMPDESEAAERRQRIIALSRQKYGTPRAEVEAMLFKPVETKIEPKFEAPAPTPPQKPPLVPKAAEPAQLAEVPKVSEPEPAPAPEAVEPVPSGDEDNRHTEIKRQIGDQAESLDYTVSYEKSVLDGKGRIDVVLSRGKRQIACEVSVMNTVHYEVGNVTKCLEAGFGQVAVVCPARGKLTRIEQAVARTISEAQLPLVAYYQPKEFIARLSEWAAEDPEGAIVEQGKPRKQKITLNAGELTEVERKQRENEMLKRLAEAMRKKKSG